MELAVFLNVLALILVALQGCYQTKREKCFFQMLCCCTSEGLPSAVPSLKVLAHMPTVYQRFANNKTTWLQN